MRLRHAEHRAVAALLLEDSLDGIEVFDVREELGSVLDLVDDKRSLETLEEQRRDVLRQTAIFQSVQET